jgi:hypothetical protein
MALPSDHSRNFSANATSPFCENILKGEFFSPQNYFYPKKDTCPVFNSKIVLRAFLCVLRNITVFANFQPLENLSQGPHKPASPLV